VPTLEIVTAETMSFDFTGKKVLVTGAGRGIGRGVALALVKAGCKVYALDCVEESLASLRTESSKIVTILQDLSNWETTRVALESLEVLDGLVNNAAVVEGYGPALELSKDDLDRGVAVNLFAVINCIQVVCKKMVDAGRTGSVVNISSIAGQKALPQALGYCVSKAGVDMVTKQFALELGSHNIRVNSVNLTAVDTDMIPPEKKETTFELVVERMPISRPGTVHDVVGPVLYLLSDYSSMVTGTTHLVDGGKLCNITTKS